MSGHVETIALEEVTESKEFRQALDIAAQNADDVDRRGRFPSEAIDALRAAGALAWGVPRRYGGAGAGIDTLSEATFELSRRCASASMIFAMHQIQVACIVRHSRDSLWFADYLRCLARTQRLIASATSEAGVGGDIRKSVAALQPSEDSSAGWLGFEKDVPTVSYGAQADDLLTTVRRSAEADPGDQLLVLTHASEMEMKQTSEWDTLGMRGTCSPGFFIRAHCLPDQVLPVPFATIAAESMVPYSHILWAHVWLGIATDAFARSQKFVRDQARANPGATRPSALRLAELSTCMSQLRSLIEVAAAEYTSVDETPGYSVLSTVGYSVRINNLKIAASESVLEACQCALRICGVLGYRNCGPYSISRHLRDAQSAVLMVSNDRLQANNAASLLVHREAR